MESHGETKSPTKKKLKGDGDEQALDQEGDFEACDLVDDDESIADDGEVTSEHSEKEIDLDAFAKFCKENPMDDGEEGSYDSEEDEDYDSDDEVAEVLVGSSDEDDESMNGGMISADSGSSCDDDSVEEPEKKKDQEMN